MQKSSLGGYYQVHQVNVVAYQIKKLFGILQFTENDEIFFKRFVFVSISNLMLNMFWLG